MHERQREADAEIQYAQHAKIAHADDERPADRQKRQPFPDELRHRKIIIEQNRCAMACQGCGIAIFLFYTKTVESKS